MSDHQSPSSEILSSARFTSRSTSSPSYSSPYDQAPTASSILSQSIDPASLHPLAALSLSNNKDLDYLLLDDDKLSGVEGGKSVLPSRGWGDELCYGTGSTYLAGLAVGGLWGLREGIRKPLMPRTPTPPTSTLAPTAGTIGAQATAFASAATEGAAQTQTEGEKANARAASKVSARLRWNSILNQVTRRGSFTGNSAGVLALIYNGFNSTLDSYRGGKHDIYGSMFAGACTGALWKCTAGVQPAIIAAGLMTVGAAGWTTVKTQFL